MLLIEPLSVPAFSAVGGLYATGCLVDDTQVGRS